MASAERGWGGGGGGVICGWRRLRRVISSGRLLADAIRPATLRQPPSVAPANRARARCRGDSTRLRVCAASRAVLMCRCVPVHAVGRGRGCGVCRDNSLNALLHEAFKLLELRFQAYDQDGAQTLMYKELEHQLSLVGFCDQEKLEALFRRCSPRSALPHPAKTAAACLAPSRKTCTRSP